MAGTGGRHGPRRSAEQVIDDRQVVRGQIPEDVDIVLEQPEVDADAIEVEDITQFAARELRMAGYTNIYETGLVTKTLVFPAAGTFAALVLAALVFAAWTFAAFAV